MSPTCAHPDCATEFGIFSWRHTCFRCGVVLCSQHIHELPEREAKRRFVHHDDWQSEGEGLCHDCEAQRHVDTRGWLEGAGPEGTLLHAFADDIGAAMDQHFRVAARLPAPDRDLVVLVPLEPTRTHLMFAWQSGTEMTLCAFQSLEGLLEAVQSGAVTGVDGQGRACVSAENGAATVAWARRLWKTQDVDSRAEFILQRGAGPKDAVRDLVLAEEASLCAPLNCGACPGATTAVAAIGGAGIGAAVAKAFGAQKKETVAGAAVAGGLAGFLLAIALEDQEDGPPRRYRTAVRSASALPPERRSEAMDKAVDAFFMARPDGASADLNEAVADSWRSTALMGRWLHRDKRGALVDAAECASPNPWAVALAAASGHRDPLRSILSRAYDVPFASFPWPVLFQRVHSALNLGAHWTRRSLGELSLRGRCGVGATKEVWELADRPGTVACLALPGRETALEGEVELLRAVGRHVGSEGRRLGLPEVLACGSAEVGGRKTLGYLTRNGRPFTHDAHRRLQSTADVVRVVRRLARTLGALHNARYVHGDLKPENLLWGADDELVLCDFDSAAHLGSDGYATSLRSTPPYAAPEQASGRMCARSDIHALGRLAENLLSGVRDRPTRQDLAPGPRKLMSLLDRCTLQAPDRRPSAEEVEAELDDWLSGPRAAMTRLSTAEVEAKRRLVGAISTWRRTPSEPVQRALLAGIESRFVLLHKPDSDAAAVRAVARNLVDAAQKTVLLGLIEPWADAVRHGGVDRLGRLTNVLRDKERRAHKRHTAERIRAVLTALEGRQEIDLSLARMPSLLTGNYHSELQDEWRGWLSLSGAVPDLQAMADRCGELGRLRNDLHHDASQQQRRAYGKVEGNALVLNVGELLRIEEDVLGLAGWVYGTR